jgi:mitogen-activated protein kinase kinase kinase 13
MGNRSHLRPPSSPSESPLVPSPSPRKTRAQAKQTGKQKHVEFSTTSFSTPLSETQTETEPDTDHQKMAGRQTEPSPRRLRHRRPATDSEAPNRSAAPHRGVRPPRKARFEDSMRESSTEDDDDEDEDATVHPGDTDETSDASRSPSSGPEAEEDVDELSDEVMDVDEEAPSSPQEPRSPIRRTRSSSHSFPAPPALNKRARLQRPAQTHTPPSDEDGDSDEGPGEVEPRVLRNGKIVGEVPEEGDDGDEEVDQLDDNTDEQIKDNENGSEPDADYIDEEEDGVGEDEGDDLSVVCRRRCVVHVSLQDLDLSRENLKTLLRRRREDLVKLCEANDIDADGTKNQLAHALLEWVRLCMLTYCFDISIVV